MAQVNMSLRIDAELKDAFMAAAKSMDRNGSQLIRDFMRQTVERQHNTWFRNLVTEGRQELNAVTWSNPLLQHGGMKLQVNDGDILDHANQPGQEAHVIASDIRR